MSVRNVRQTASVRDRVAANPRPAVIWTGVAVVLLAPELPALVHFLNSLLIDIVKATPGTLFSVSLKPVTSLLLSVLQPIGDVSQSLPTLLSRDLIANRGYWDGSGYVGTFLGLPPFQAWLIRVVLVYAYAFAAIGWAWVGYNWYREHYRAADWTPRDDFVDRFRDHTWGKFGFLVVFMFLVMVVFAPTLAPTTVEQNISNPYGHTIQYWNAESGAVEEVTVGLANRQSRSVGNRNVGPMSYDDYGRFHPFGTMPGGKDLFTFIAAGSRISLIIGLFSVVLSALIATLLALVSAFYKGWVDDGIILVSDAVMAMPQLLLIIMLTVVLADTWIGNLYSGAFVLALIFAGTGWPYMWRSLRGPSLQISERQWVDAARAYGQRPLTIMRKHMLPYILGYLLIYGSMTLGGAIIAIAGLSFLGLGINPPTPEWGRAVNMGQDYVDTASWHISLIPGVLITLVVTGFNALGDGIRDAIDPQSDSAEGEAGGRGGGA